MKEIERDEVVDGEGAAAKIKVSTQSRHSLFPLISKVFRINVILIENKMSMLFELGFHFDISMKVIVANLRFLTRTL
jgi:hypothetical protein